MNARRIGWRIVGLLSLCAAARAGPALVGATHDGVLYDINPNTGAATNPRALGIGEVTGLAWSPSGRLLVGTGSPATVPNALYTVGLDGSSPTFVGSIGRGSLDFDRDPLTGLIYALESAAPGTSGSTLFTVDPGTAQVAQVAWMFLQGGPIVLDSTGRLLGFDFLGSKSDQLLLLDRGNGDILTSWAVGTHLYTPGLAFGPDGTLYIAEENLYSFDLQGQSLTQLGPTGLANRIIALAYVPESSSAGLFALVGLLIAYKSRRAAKSALAPVAMAILIAAAPLNAQEGGTAGAGGGTSTATVETGLGQAETLVFRTTLRGDFVAAGASTRNFVCTGCLPLQTGPVPVTITGIPVGGVVIKAFANWSYLTNDPINPSEAAISINGIGVIGSLSGESNDDLCWDSVVEHTRTRAYTADVTTIVTNVGGNGLYTITDASDEPTTDGWGGLAEGISVLVIWSHPSEPVRLINVWSGMVTTVNPPLTATAVLNFAGPGPNCQWYLEGPAHFFVNALDGQSGPNDTWKLNSIVADGFPGTGSPNAWRGLLGPHTDNNYYDHADGDASGFMTPGEYQLRIVTQGLAPAVDCIGHSFAAIAFLGPENCGIVGPGDPSDCDGDGVPDVCEIECGVETDCNNNGVPDSCDIVRGVSLDCEPNGVPDECEADCNGNGVPDACDITRGTSCDLDGNGVPDECAACCVDGTCLNRSPAQCAGQSYAGQLCTDFCCPSGVCCLGEACTAEFSACECRVHGGHPAHSGLCVGTPCATGSCCVGAGECEDGTLGVPMSKALCDADSGTFVGGVRCYGGTCTGTNAGRSCNVDSQCPQGTCAGDAAQLAQPSPCAVPPPPPLTGEIVWDSDPLSVDRTTRSLRFMVSPPCPATGTPGQDAIQVTMIGLQHPVPPNGGCCPPQDFHTYESATCTGDPVGGGGCARWVGKPATFLESQDQPGIGNYRAARLQCTPFYHNWVTETATKPITVVGAEIMPSSEYSVRAYHESCAGHEYDVPDCAGAGSAVLITTRRSGDVTAPYQDPLGSLSQPDGLDVGLLVAKFKGALSPSKGVLQLQPNLLELNGDINALDIVAGVDAFRGKAYSFAGPCPCPSIVPCGTACANPSDCSGGMCVKTCVGGTKSGEPCIWNENCWKCSSGDPQFDGIPCGQSVLGPYCPWGGCDRVGTCGNRGDNPGFCRDRCGRCNP